MLVTENFNLHAARALAERVKCADIFRAKAGVIIADEEELSWFRELEDGEHILGEDDLPRDLTTARNFLDLESLVRALDSMETIASSAGITQEYVKVEASVMTMY